MNGQKITRLFHQLFAVLFFGVFILIILYNRTPYFSYIAWKMVLVFLIGLFLVKGIIYIWKKEKWEFFIKKEKIIVPILFFVYFVTQMFLAWKVRVLPTDRWDFGVVFQSAYLHVYENQMPGEYFTLFHNNAPLYLVLHLLFSFCKWIGIQNVLPIALGMNALFVDISLFGIYMILRKLYTVPCALLGLGSAFLFPVFWMYVPIVYSDTLSMPFPIWALYFWIGTRKAQDRTSVLRGSLITGFLCAVGTWLKVTVGIVVIAILIDIIFQPMKKKIEKSFSLVVVFSISLFLLSFLTTHNNLLPEYQKEKSIPPVHWVMMGLEGDGGYHDPSYEITLQGKDYDERMQYAQEEMKKRLINMGLRGFVSHSVRKISYTWGDGMYFAPIKLDRSAAEPGNIIQQYAVQGMRYQGRLAYFSASLHLMLLFGLAVSAFYASKENDALMVARVAIVGLFIFLIFWETRSRYLVHFIPVFWVAAFPHHIWLKYRAKQKEAELF